MAEEPQPSTVQEGASTPPAATPGIDTTKESAKEAAALSTLDARGEEEDTKSSNKLSIDQEALGKAISRLEVNAGEGTTGKAKGLGGDYSERRKAELEKRRAEEERKKKVKVDQNDVALLVQELELTKPKATDLLKTHEGDAVKAMRAFVRASA